MGLRTSLNSVVKKILSLPLLGIEPRSSSPYPNLKMQILAVVF